ncbi:MAG: transposase [Saprospiraceae bacterium]|nr:transposase [Saprospiraceae bacterium]
MSVKYKIRDQHGLNYLTCSIIGWVDLFSRQIYRDMVLDSWRYCQEHKGFQVHAYTIMSNHLHLIACCRAPHRLEATMRDWKHFTATKILDYLKDTTQPESRREWLLYLFSFFAAGKKHKQIYQVWQHDNHPIELYSEQVIAQKINYTARRQVMYITFPALRYYSSHPSLGHAKNLAVRAIYTPQCGTGRPCRIAGTLAIQQRAVLCRNHDRRALQNQALPTIGEDRADLAVVL